ncbi:LAME_0H15148g1_1 [Lachancea meyersii CBS 8951]|uniref:pyridoxal kinase n=1 Tax=Lachancea meyersii CBS 8951 TaxID=1266667 RepID=A0A1G4KHQ5_9SACH|nr:LAME_0H15148g1_1 [Lachancea meyersii CBS 8951]
MTKKVLSIQSHVVHGYVGNKAATFPLQYRGWDVDALNTVQYSNHPGYGHFDGFRSRAQDLREIIEKGLLEGLQQKYDALLTGYLPDPEALREIGDVLATLCESDSEIKWILDPVLGDNGRLYVSPDAVPAYKEILLRGTVYLATPNQFEMETLTGVQITDLATLKLSITRFHELYPKVPNVLVTSVMSSTLDQDTMICACSELSKPDSARYFSVPKIDVHFSGSGDLCSALLLDIFLRQPSEALDLARAANEVLSLVDNILKRTLQLHLDTQQKALGQDRPRKINDLRLIESRDLLDGSGELKYTPMVL